jgi:hypothetical protein
VASLVWCGDELVDWVAGGVRYGLDGSSTSASRFYAYRFDAAVGTPDGEWAVLYTRLGTKGLLLRNHDLVRELDRSYYCADAYEFPVALWRRPSGQVLLAHCPGAYNRIEIDDAETGERLTATADERAPADFFHSRLQVSPGGTHLLSAGWVWHPWDAVAFFRIENALADGRHLDGLDGCTPESRHIGLAEEGTACWQTDTRLLIGGTDEAEEPDDAAEAVGPRLRRRGIAIYDLEEKACVLEAQLAHPPGTMMPVGESHVVSFYDHPRLIALESGDVLAEWPDLPSGKQASSIIRHIDPPPPLALDPANRRFAVAVGAEIVVVNLGLPTGS